MAARYTLYIGSKRISSWSLRPWLAMRIAKLAFDEVVIPLRKPETGSQIKVHSPSAKVPALRIEEGGLSRTVWDSLAICETLAERHPQARLWPEDSNARAEARSIVAEMHSGFPDLRRVLPMDIAARYPTPPLEDAVQSQIARIIELWQSVLGRYGKSSGFLFGHFTIADAFYAPVATRFETYGVHLPPVAQAYTQRILTTPAMREWEESARGEAPP
ncbi:MAG: glutathione S-transferase [Alphaproteobacteria bacterium]|jgi:glutathione S-transferase|nr:glutathione S-transferase [Alphaproteobacteria bacterium]